MKLISAILSLVATYEVSAFVVSPSLNNAANYKQHYGISSIQQQQQSYHTQQRQPLYMSITDTDNEDLISEVKSMRVAAIKQELESYGISTKTFLEKSELVDALVQARKEGKTPIASSNTSASTTTTSTTPSSTTTATTTQAPMSNEDRQAKLQSEIEKCKATKVGDLKSELESYGISTKSYFEKSEFVQAVAEARVDGVTKKSKKKKRRTVDDDGDDEVEEVKAKVEVITSDSVGPKTKKSRDASQEQQSSGSPFGGGAGGGSPFGGMGGSGGLEDILKGMGGMGGAGGSSPFGAAAGGANPFGGAAGGSPFGAAAGGANPFGGMGGGGGGGMEDAMKAAQQAMSNPKVMAVIQKAQKNPKVMQAVQECMGNPMAMSKYMSDPDVGPILKELQEAMM